MASNQTSSKLSSESFVDAGLDNRFLTTALNELYLDSETADVYFIFGADKKIRIPAHKVLLAANCDAFKAMFYGGKLDKEVPNVSIHAFKEFLQFFYFDKVKLNIEHIADVLNLGKTFLFPSCLGICERFLINSLCVGSVCMSYGLAIRFGLNNLIQKCEVMIAEKTEEVFQSTGFIECKPSVLSHILKLDLLSCGESVVFRSCVEWVKAASGEKEITKQIFKKHFGDLLFDIRFRSMTIEEFTTLLSKYGDLFSCEEYQEIVQLIVSKDCCPKLFHAKPRKKQDEEISIECSCIREECKMTAFYFQDIESIQFTVSKTIMLAEIVCSQITISNKDKSLPAEMMIIEKSKDGIYTQRILCHQKITLKSEPMPTIIPLENRILVIPGMLYEIQFKQCPASSQFFCKPFKAEVHLPDADIVVKFQTNTKTREKISLICGLNFKMGRKNA